MSRHMQGWGTPTCCKLAVVSDNAPVGALGLLLLLLLLCSGRVSGGRRAEHETNISHPQHTAPGSSWVALPWSVLHSGTGSRQATESCAPAPGARVKLEPTGPVTFVFNEHLDAHQGPEMAQHRVL